MRRILEVGLILSFLSSMLASAAASERPRPIALDSAQVVAMVEHHGSHE